MDKKSKQLYQFRASIIKALSNPIRLAIVDFLAEGEKCVCEIVEHLGEKQSGISRHLATLRNSGIVQTRKEGLQIYYSLKTPCIIGFFNCIDNILKELHAEKEEIIKNI